MHTTHASTVAPAVWKGAIAGLAGGLVAAWTMNQFQAAVSALASPDDGGGQPGGDDATMKAASAISMSVINRGLTKDEKRVGGPIVHYTFGTAMGVLYGIVVEMTPAAAGAWGLPFGAALWLAADEIAVPAAGLSGPPTDAPLATHATALAAHLVYGATADAVRRVVRATLT